MFVRDVAVRPSRECDITFFVKGRPKSARQARDSTVAARRVQSVTVPSSRVSRECCSPQVKVPPPLKLPDWFASTGYFHSHFGLKRSILVHVVPPTVLQESWSSVAMIQMIRLGFLGPAGNSCLPILRFSNYFSENLPIPTPIRNYLEFMSLPFQGSVPKTFPICTSSEIIMESLQIPMPI